MAYNGVWNQINSSSEWLRKIHSPKEEYCPQLSTVASVFDPFGLGDLQVLHPSNFKAQHYELHHLSDASVSGYGMCTYLRAVSTSDEIHCSSVMGRSRVPPSKVTTIPRLELSVAVVAVRSGDMLKKELEMQISEEGIGLTLKWCSATTVMRPEGFTCLLQTVWNASDKVQSQHNGGNVTTKDNPADYASRGLTAEQFVASNCFKGPDFLWQKVITSGELKVVELSNSDVEVKKVQVHKIQSKEQRSLLDRLHKFSNWLRMIKAFVRLKRYIKEAKDLKKSCDIVNNRGNNNKNGSGSSVCSGDKNLTTS